MEVMTTIKMKIKDCILIEPFTCKEDDNIVDVAKKLREITLRHIFVVDENEFPKGIISIIDINNRIVAESKDPSKTLAKDIMSTPIDVANIEDDVEELSKKLIEKNHVLAPVVENEKIIGIITIHQVLKNLNKE